MAPTTSPPREATRPSLSLPLTVRETVRGRRRSVLRTNIGTVEGRGVGEGGGARRQGLILESYGRDLRSPVPDKIGRA